MIEMTSNDNPFVTYLEPNEGNLYGPHSLQIDSGTFWRCKHGKTGFGKNLSWRGCLRCAISNPRGYIRFKKPLF